MNAEATSVRDTEAIGRGIPGRWSTPPSDSAIRAVQALGMVPLRLLATRMGRRVAAATVLSLLLVGVVSALYSHADSPASLQRPLIAAPAAASKPASGSHAAGAAKAAGASRETPLASVAASRPAKDPQHAAVAWYAKRVGVAPDHVQALQEQRVNATTTKVLVMAQVSQTNVPSAFLTVKRVDGGWKVP